MAQHGLVKQPIPKNNQSQAPSTPRKLLNSLPRKRPRTPPQKTPVMTPPQKHPHNPNPTLSRVGAASGGTFPRRGACGWRRRRVRLFPTTATGRPMGLAVWCCGGGAFLVERGFESDGKRSGGGVCVVRTAVCGLLIFGFGVVGGCGGRSAAYWGCWGRVGVSGRAGRVLQSVVFGHRRNTAQVVRPLGVGVTVAGGRASGRRPPPSERGGEGSE